MPLAERIHREDLLIPESLIKQYAELGFFGSSIPSGYGGTDMGYLTMVVLTEELSAASLICGSLLTRCEILARALLVGGTERAEAGVAPQDGIGRGARWHRNHRAGHRFGDGLRAVPGDAGGGSRRSGVQDQRGEGMGDVRRPCGRAGAARPHRPDAGEQGPVVAHRAEGAVVRPQVRGEGTAWRALDRRGDPDAWLPRHAQLHTQLRGLLRPGGERRWRGGGPRTREPV